MPEVPNVIGDARNEAMDALALRHLVTRSQLAKAIWHPRPRESLRKALKALHGSEASKIEVSVSQETLATVLKAVAAALEVTGNGKILSSAEAQHANDMIRLAVSLQLEEEHFDDNVQQGLLCAWIHVAVPLLLDAGPENLQTLYRTLIDVARQEFPSSNEHAQNLRQQGISCIKGIVRVIHEHSKRDRKHLKARVMSIADKFFEEYPISGLLKVLLSEAARISDSLPELTFHTPDETIDGTNVRKRTSLKRLANRDAVPDFFSDADGSEIDDIEPDEQDEEHRVRSGRGRRSKGGHHYVNSVEKESRELDHNLEGGRRRSRKRKRSSSHAEVLDANGAGMEPEGEGISGERALPWKLRARKHEQSIPEAEQEALPDLEPSEREEVDQLASEDFSGSSSDRSEEQSREDPSYRDVEHVARHAKVRRGSRRGKHGSPKDRAVFIKAEPRSPRHNPNSASEESSDEEEKMRQDELDRAAISGRGGETVRDLHKLTSNLRDSGIPDPLSEAQKDARHVRHRARTSALHMYSPASNAREASPIPGSEARISRKKQNRLRLDESPPNSEPRRTPQKFHGKHLRTGRFGPHEDEFLIVGLKKYGWGSWTSIAKDFGDGSYTRAPMSLKDRARTLELDPRKYPLPRSVTKKGRPPEYRASAGRDKEMDDSIEESDERDSDADENETE